MTFEHYKEEIILYILNLEKDDIILGHTQLKLHNPRINWKMDEVTMCRCPPSYFKRKATGKPKKNQKKTFTTINLEDNSIDIPIIFSIKDVEEVEEDSLCMTRLLCQKNQTEKLEPVAIRQDLKNKIPEDLHEYLLIFDKKAAARMPVKNYRIMRQNLKRTSNQKGPRFILYYQQNERKQRNGLNNDLFPKPEKYIWQTNKIKSVSIIVSHEGVHMAPEKVKAIETWKEPKTVKEIRSFLGFANYYYYFIKDFAKIAKSLVELIKKNIEWSWTSAC